MILVSACLAGIRCRYDSRSCAHPLVVQAFRSGLVLAVCPERLGGRPTPRIRSWIPKGDGTDVLAAKQRVFAGDAYDVTTECVAGAAKMWKIAKLNGIDTAILKDGSASCGTTIIPDGQFCRAWRRGQGVAAALLRRNGIVVYSERAVESVAYELHAKQVESRVR